MKTKFGRGPRASVAGIVLVATAAAGLSACGADKETGTAAAGAPKQTLKADAKGVLGTDGLKQLTPKCSGDDKLKVAFFQNTLNNTFVNAEIAGAKKAATDCNLDVKVFNANFETAQQINQIEDAITSGGYKVFVIQAVDANPIVPVVKQALKAGITVSVPNTQLGDVEDRYPGTVTYVGHKELIVGNQVGKMALQALGEKCGKIAIITGVADSPISKNRSSGFEKAVAANPKCKVVATQAGDFDEGKAQTVAENLLQANPDLALIYTQSDNMGAGAANAIKDAGKTDQVKVLGVGASKQGLALVASGGMYGTIFFRPFIQGQLATVAGAASARGVPSSQIAPFYNDSGDAILTKANVSGFKAEW